MKKTILVIVLLVVVAGVSGGGVYFWQKSILDKEKASLEKEITDLMYLDCRWVINELEILGAIPIIPSYLSPKGQFSATLTLI